MDDTTNIQDPPLHSAVINQVTVMEVAMLSLCSICWGENQDADSGFMNVSSESCGLVISIPLEGLCDLTAPLNFREKHR